MAKAKLTPWFLGDVKPARVGVYERKMSADKVFSYWDGEYWHSNSHSKYEAYYYKPMGFRSWFQSLPWRGLAEKPKEK